MIRGITFKEQKFKTTDMALVIRRFLFDTDGIIEGIDISHTDTNIIMSNGFFVSSGYMTEIFNQEVISATTGTLIYKIDLNKENTESIFTQGTFEIINREPIQENLFTGGKIYELPFAKIEMTQNIVSKMTILINNLTVQKIPKIFDGTGEPDNKIGKDGDFYCQYEEDL